MHLDSEYSEYTVLKPEAREDFILTPFLEGIMKRALAYLKGGFPVHFSGPAGSGKTTLALYVASRLDRPLVAIYGDEEYRTVDLLGGGNGYRLSKTVDNFIHSVLKVDESMAKRWVDHRLSLACKNGYTLLYDEFNRSRPEANNVLLSVLEEGLLCMPSSYTGGNTYQAVHSDFRVIFTSNPMEYAGIHDTQDALLDRMVTINLTYPDSETEVKIAQAKSGLPSEDVETVVKIVRGLRERNRNHRRPTLRASITISKISAQEGIPVSLERDFLEICSDIIGASSSNGSSLTLEDIRPYFPNKGDRTR
ncbi:MAG TPA: gas vesicle protein GvpN [Candidatus Hypogeohydataceae bacterium YC41]